MKYKVLSTDKMSQEYLETIGLIGEKCKQLTMSKGNVALVFKEIKNNASSYGCFYYKKSEVEILREEDLEMKENKVYLEAGYKVAQVEFLDGINRKLYNYAVYEEWAKEGDIAVTDTDKVVKIHRILSLEDCEKEHFMKPYAQLKGVIPIEFYNTRIEKANKKVELKKQMDERVRQLQNEQIYELFAEKDQSLKELLEEYKAI